MAIKKLIELDERHPKHIAVIGDALTDVWVHGELSPCQDNCDKFVETSRIVTNGGAANAANCLANWHTRVTLYAQKLRGTKTRYISGGSIVLRHDRERVGETCPSIGLSQYDAILLSDYDKGFLSEARIASIIIQARELQIPCVADVKRPSEIFEGAIRKGNDAYRGVVEVRTRGSKPPLVFGRDVMEHTTPIKCNNHVGAGDCFAAHLTLALAYGFCLSDSAYIAHAAGRAYVQHVYNRPPLRSEILGI